MKKTKTTMFSLFYPLQLHSLLQSHLSLPTLTPFSTHTLVTQIILKVLQLYLQLIPLTHIVFHHQALPPQATTPQQPQLLHLVKFAYLSLPSLTKIVVLAQNLNVALPLSLNPSSPQA